MSKLNWGKRAYAVFLLCATTAIPLPAQTFTTLHSFDNVDGSEPPEALIQATGGNLYGITHAGGVNGYGTIFRITPTGTLTTIYAFCSQSGCTDGEYPLGGLVQATNGNFYGTTQQGGANSAGTVFKITTTGTLTTLHSFCSQSACRDGEEPQAAMIQASDGNLYGMTPYGGVRNCGTVFRITPSGRLNTLHSFCAKIGSRDGANPQGALVQATDGNFYGTTYAGGVNNFGTVFKITPAGTLTTLYSFCSQSGCTDGYYPYVEALVQATDGNFYGTTYGGGVNGLGTVFKMTPGGTLTTLYSFCSQSGCADGEEPAAGLVQATDGNFYGTTYHGGASGHGTVFEITPTGTLATLYNFCSQSGCADGGEPFAALVQDTNGNFYGATDVGGANNAGTVFSLSVGLGPFVETEPTSGKVGAAVKILGTNLGGATSVSFNGTAAVFKVVSNTLITTTVPAGATTGTVQVVEPKRTLSSNVPFRVLP